MAHKNDFDEEVVFFKGLFMGIQGWVFQFRKGFTEFVLLNLMQHGQCYGYELLEALKEGSFSLQAGNLYRTLGRLEQKGYVKSHFERSGDGPMRKYYALTEEGRRRRHQMNNFWENVRMEVDVIVAG